ncbi:MAG: glycosyltransferase family 2 protein [Planctomycetes bacterium]|nr:glycosyltransferase family 2 protein [Planctomycetota bacterium]
MYEGRRIIAIVPAYNEQAKIGHVVARTPRDVVDELLVVDDGSTDDTGEVARSGGANVLSLGSVQGVGAALRRGLYHARTYGHDVAVIMAGNNKDDPSEIPRLLEPICCEGFDIVVGSRFLSGGAYVRRGNAAVPEGRDPPPSLAVGPICREILDRINQWVSRDTTRVPGRCPHQSRPSLARWIRFGGVFTLQDDRMRVSAHRSAMHEDISPEGGGKH